MCAPNLVAAAAETDDALTSRDGERLLEAILELSRLRDLVGVAAAVRRAARALTGADGVTFVLRDGEQVHYLDEEAIGPLWKGRRFPARSCISGWACEHRQSVAIEDIYADARIPHDVYRPTFVKSLAMVPIRKDDPIGAIGAYWSSSHRATARELRLLESLAGASAVAVANAEHYQAVQQAVRVRDQFLSLASHELHTPLTPLSLQLDRLARALGQVPAGEAVELKEGFDQARLYTRRLTRTVDRLLDVATLSEGKLHLAPEPLELGEVVIGVVDRVRDALERSGSPLQLQAEARVEGRWDRRRVSQVAEELLTNAIKFGEGRPIRVAVGRAPRAARLVIADQGAGMSSEEQARLFNRFGRTASPAHYGGLGLGLWMARQLVTAMGGEVGVWSAPGNGATFTVQLPLGDAA